MDNSLHYYIRPRKDGIEHRELFNIIKEVFSSSVPPEQMEDLLSQLQGKLEQKETAHIDDIACELSAYLIKDEKTGFVNEEQIGNYRDQLLGAVKTSKETFIPQVVEGESEFFYVVHGTGSVARCIPVQYLDVYTEFGLAKKNLEADYAKGDIPWETFRSELDRLKNLLSLTE